MSIKLRKFYIQDIKNQVGAAPLWPVSVCYKLGDYGYYGKGTGEFSVRGNIFDDLGVPKDVIIRADEKAKLYNMFNSANTTKNNFNLNAQVQDQGGTLDMAFEGDYAYFFHLFRAEVSYLKLSDPVRQKIAEARQQGKWNHRYRIIELIYECPDIRFTYSLSKTSALNLSGKVDVAQVPTKVNINYKMITSANMDGSLWIEGSKSTPFARFASFKRRVINNQFMAIKSGDDWDLSKDTSGSFDDNEDMEGQLDSLK